MRIRKVRARRSSVFLMWFLMALMAGCQAIAPAPSAPEQGTPEQVTPEQLDVWDDNQIILLGSPGAVDQAAADLNLSPIEDVAPLEIGDLIATEYEQDAEQLQALLRQVLEIDVAIEQRQRIQAGDLVARLFDLSEQELSVAAIIESVTALRQEFAGEYDRGFVFAQPNFWVMPAVPPIQTTCTGVGAAPHPSTIGGGAYGDPFPTPTAAQFEQQDAFMQLTDDDPAALTQGAAGAEVKIAIFDTSPFASEGDGLSFSGLQLDEVIHYNPQTQPSGAASHKNEHGLFVAGLARAVAPNSKIALIRILDDDACGTLSGLNTGLLHLLFETPKQEKLVINLSLVYKLGQEPHTAKEYLTQLLIHIASNRPYTVVVAAAGNEGVGQPTLHPAAYYTQMPLLAVAANKSIEQKREPSCFSNAGSVSAPGGEGAMPDCKPSIKEAENLISVVTSATSPSNYAYWSGTSFAAPLVSGLAARCLSNGDSAATTIGQIDVVTPDADMVSLNMCP